MIRKRIDPKVLSDGIKGWYPILGPAILAWVLKQQEDPDGVMIDVNEVAGDIYGIIDDHLIPYFNDYVKDHMGPIDPEELDKDPIEPPDTPEPEPDVPDLTNEIKIMNTGKKMSWNGKLYDKFVFPNLGPEYTSKPFKLVFSDGKELPVPDPKKMNMKYPENMKYQPGGMYSGNNPDIPTMEVYAWKDTHPEWVKAVFQHPVDSTPNDHPVAPEQPDSSDKEFTVTFGGQNLPDTGYESRDRMWWTKIHGGSHPIWSRKFPLPDWVDDASYTLKIKYSDGAEFTVPNTRAEFYMTSVKGPKYRPKDPNERDPKKMHPKVSAKEGTKPNWIKVRAIPNR